MSQSDPRPHLDPKDLLRSAVRRGTPVPVDPKAIERLQRAFPELEVEGRIGQGGMASVYRCRQRQLDRPVALKILAAELAESKEFTERLQREARAMAQLDHPNILRVLDCGERQGLCFILTELIDGTDLRKLMDMGELSTNEALRLLPQLCDALAFAHERGVVHRDIKPENILIDLDGRVKLADFGLARLVDGDREMLTRTSQVMGTPHYMAPEQWRTGEVDHRADIFALGVVLYELLTGRLPIGDFAQPSTQRTDVPARLDQVVRRALAQDPELRFQQVADLRRALRGEAVADEPSAPASAPSAPEHRQSAQDAQQRGPGLFTFVPPPILITVGGLLAFVISMGGSLSWGLAGLCATSVPFAGFHAMRSLQARPASERGSMWVAMLMLWFIPLFGIDYLVLSPLLDSPGVWRDTGKTALFYGVGTIVLAANILFLVWQSRRAAAR